MPSGKERILSLLTGAPLTARGVGILPMNQQASLITFRLKGSEELVYRLAKECGCALEFVYGMCTAVISCRSQLTSVIVSQQNSIGRQAC
jgi:hypothetical protein